MRLRPFQRWGQRIADGAATLVSKLWMGQRWEAGTRFTHDTMGMAMVIRVIVRESGLPCSP